MVPLFSGIEFARSGKDPVLVLFAEINANLKELNLILKNYIIRLARLEIQQPSGESSPENQKVEPGSGNEAEISEPHRTEKDPDQIRRADK